MMTDEKWFEHSWLTGVGEGVDVSIVRVTVSPVMCAIPDDEACSQVTSLIQAALADRDDMAVSFHLDPTRILTDSATSQKWVGTTFVPGSIEVVLDEGAPPDPDPEVEDD
jgi:hypothetical protein